MFSIFSIYLRYLLIIIYWNSFQDLNLGDSFNIINEIFEEYNNHSNWRKHDCIVGKSRTKCIPLERAYNRGSIVTKLAIGTLCTFVQKYFFEQRIFHYF